MKLTVAESNTVNLNVARLMMMWPPLRCSEYMGCRFYFNRQAEVVGIEALPGTTAHGMARASMALGQRIREQLAAKESQEH